MLIESLRIRQQLFDGDNPDLAQSFNNLAEVYHDQGRYSEAESLYTEALEIRKRLFGNEHLAVAVSLNNLALLYQYQGRYSEAEPLYEEALTIQSKLIGYDHPNMAALYNNLALLYQYQGKYSEAETYYNYAIALFKKLFGKNHPEVANSLNNLALLYQYQERYSEAKSLYNESLTILKQLFGSDHILTANITNNLALLYSIQGRYSEAESLYTKTLEMVERLFSDNHRDFELGLHNLGMMSQAQEKYSQALEYLTQASEVQENIISENLLIGSEEQKRQFLDLFLSRTYTTISFHLQAIPENAEAAELALTTILRRKGRILDAMGQTMQNLRNNLDPQSEQLFAQLTSTQTELAKISYNPLPDDATQREDIQNQQKELDKQIKQLEAQLSSRSAEFAQTTTPVTIEQVQQAIPENAALVEFIQYEPFDAKKDTYGEPRYAVYVLLPNGQMEWQDLGKAVAIDAQIEQFRKMLGSGERGLNDVPITYSIEEIKQTAREIDKLLMQPVRAMSGNATHLLLSPDSQLNLLPFAALVDEDDNYLVQNYLITYLTSGRDLLRLQLNQDTKTTTPLLFANPTYSDEGVIGSKNNSSKQNNNSRGRRSAELATIKPFLPLRGTEIEGDAIKKLIPQFQLFTEQQASENNIKDKQNQNPEFLHIATHGFFIAPEKASESSRNYPNATMDNQPVFSTAENPLLRSGLALAGFNQRNSGTEDGVLTALEVTGLNLRGTKLVVTSACETGLGDVRAGEGVYGLRRAFTLAGAQSQLMSLWKVSDDGTKDLMVQYYSRIQNGEARGEALRQVQLEMIQSEERNHPFYWAAFIPSGSWLPLD